SPSVCRTVWFNQDNPFGEGDQELLVDLRKLNPQKICSVPLEIEVQTTDGIPASETGQHFAVQEPSTSKPAPLTSSGPTTTTLGQEQSTPQFPIKDYELLHDLMDENPDAICLSPVGIEVQTREGVPASETGQYFAINNTAQGFACINAQQGKGTLCLDYRVRFICPKAFCKKESSTTVSITQEPTTLTSLQSSTLGK
ncbi:hypothetical protein E2320_006139, partial [Naja naja]